MRRFLSRHPWAQYFLVVWLLAWSLAVALLLADKIGEPGRQKAAVTGFCISIREKAYAPLTDRSSEFARNDVRTSLSVYGIALCQLYTGELDQKRVSPEAFRPAPTPR